MDSISLKMAFWMGIIFLVVVYFYPDSAFAADPSSQATSFTSGVYEFLTSRWTISVVAIALAGAGFLTLRGMIPIMYLVAVTAGAFFIYGSSIIANWLYGLAS